MSRDNPSLLLTPVDFWQVSVSPAVVQGSWYPINALLGELKTDHLILVIAAQCSYLGSREDWGLAQAHIMAGEGLGMTIRTKQGLCSTEQQARLSPKEEGTH